MLCAVLLQLILAALDITFSGCGWDYRYYCTKRVLPMGVAKIFVREGRALLEGQN